MISEESKKAVLRNLDTAIKNSLNISLDCRTEEEQKEILEFVAANFPKAEHFDLEDGAVVVEHIRSGYVDIEYPVDDKPKTKRGRANKAPVLIERKIRQPKPPRLTAEQAKLNRDVGYALLNMRCTLSLSQTQAASILSHWIRKNGWQDPSLDWATLPIKQASISALEHGRSACGLSPEQARLIYPKVFGVAHAQDMTVSDRQQFKAMQALGNRAMRCRTNLGLPQNQVVDMINRSVRHETKPGTKLDVSDIILLEAGGTLSEGMPDQNALIEFYATVPKAG